MLAAATAPSGREKKVSRKARRKPIGSDVSDPIGSDRFEPVRCATNGNSCARSSSHANPKLVSSSSIPFDTSMDQRRRGLAVQSGKSERQIGSLANICARRKRVEWLPAHKQTTHLRTDTLSGMPSSGMPKLYGRDRKLCAQLTGGANNRTNFSRGHSFAHSFRRAALTSLALVRPRRR